MSARHLSYGVEMEIRCLLVDKAGCPYRLYLKEVFGHDVQPDCPYRAALKAEWEKYQRQFTGAAPDKT